MNVKNNAIEFFQNLISYYEQEGRKFPWRNNAINPYQLLITEILLRRTTSSKVAQIWYNFFNRYNEWESLAKAKPKEIEEILLPLGLQSQRAMQLNRLAKIILKEHDGKTPIEYHVLQSLPGIGEYTINSYLLQIGRPNLFPFDINVERVLSRYSGNITQNSMFLNIVFSQMPQPSKYKKVFFGILDLAAKICKPYKPVCEYCLLSNTCQFYKNKIVFERQDQHKENTVLVFSINKDQLSSLLSSGTLTTLCSSSFIGEVPCLIYVQKPYNSIIGQGALEKRTNSSCILKIKEKLSNHIKITYFRYFSLGFYPRNGINYYSPKNAFYNLIKEIEISLKMLIEEN